MAPDDPSDERAVKAGFAFFFTIALLWVVFEIVLPRLGK
jgi:hypothetical protein